MAERGDASIESRVSTLEGEVSWLKENVALARGDAAAASTLAKTADREVSDVRARQHADTRTLNALRETQIEHGREISELRAEMRQGFGMLQTGMAQIVALLTNRQRDDERPD
jgi:uncharacterized protein involved in exopolysaccharide biosynthesis